MKIAVCTLFERDYHFGVAALVNSLARAGFTGDIYAGYRGPLPPWSEGKARSISAVASVMPVAPGLSITFLQLETDAHFTNYKPDFLLQLDQFAGATSDAIIYCDPDVVINHSWSYFQDWLSCGIAVCEDVDSPLAENHPRRVGWRRFFQPSGIQFHFRDGGFANGGFIGLEWKYRKLLIVWKEMLEQASASLGGRDVAGIQGGRTLEGLYGFADCFRQVDQATLNAALESSPELPVSMLDRQAMGFASGFALVPHALGTRKPWRRHYLREALGGVPPTMADKAFWNSVDGPVKPFPSFLTRWKKFTVKVGSAISRFIRRT